MSYVTNIMITGLFIDVDGERVINHLKNFTKESMPFMYVDGSKVGGTKCLEADVFIGAFNYMDYSLFCEVIHEFKFFLDDYVFEGIQIIIKNENDEDWHIHKASELNVQCFNAH